MKRPLSPAFISGSMVQEILATDPGALQDGKYNPEPLKSRSREMGIPATILVDKNVPAGVNEVEVHRHEADLWICIDGEAHFKAGGKLVEPYAKKKGKDGTVNDLELKSKKIEGADTYTLHAGDILYIPEGVPHVHYTETEGYARLWIIKIPAKEPFPLLSVPGWK